MASRQTMFRAGRRGRSGRFKSVIRYVFFASLAVILAGLVAFGWIYLRSQPDYAGVVRIEGPKAPIYIVRDEDGIPVIDARSSGDAYFGLGYVHAQDRLLQMELIRFLGAGRLAEIVGAGALRSDIMMRSLGLYRRAGESYALLSDPARAAIDAYVAGVNAWLGRDEGLVPLLRLVGLAREPWRSADSLVWGELMAWWLSYGMHQDLLRLALRPQLENHLVAQLFVTPRPSEIASLGYTAPSNGSVRAGDDDTGRRNRALASSPDGAPDRHERTASVDREARAENFIGVMAQTLAAYGDFFAPGPRGGGEIQGGWAAALIGRGASNAWSVQGKRSKSSAPVLAADPHLSFSAPVIWHLARLQAPGFVRVGASLPGSPFQIIGHNGSIAWSMTTTGVDSQDVIIEELALDDGNRYRIPKGGSAAFIVREEEFVVRGGDTMRVQLRETRNGPVIPEQYFTGGYLPPSGVVFSLAWSHLRAPSRTGEAMYRLNEARDWDGFMDSLDHFTGPVQNIFFAARDGDIGLAVAGLLPRRKDDRGIDQPLVGKTLTDHWSGLYGAHTRFAIRNPDREWLANANGRLVMEKAESRPLAMNWLENEPRTRRLEEILATPVPLGVPEMLAIQGDHRSNLASWLMPVFLAELAKGGRANDPAIAGTVRLMGKWNASMALDRPEPLIFYAWLWELGQRLFADKFGGHEVGRATLRRYWPGQAVRLPWLLKRYPGWCDDITTADTAENCADQLAKALETALQRLKVEYGEDRTLWRWGEAHQAQFSFAPLRSVPVLGPLTNLSYPMPGDASSISRGEMRYAKDGTRFDMVHGAGLRVVFDLGNLDDSRFIIATGESWNPLSPQYANFLERWALHRAIRIPSLPKPGGSASNPWVMILHP